MAARERERVEPCGVSPRRTAASSLVMSTAAVPSVICDEFPAVITPPSGWNDGLSAARRSSDESGRMPSSRCHHLAAVCGTHGQRDDLVIEATFVCGAWRAGETPAAPVSSSSRARPHFSAISSAEMPWGTRFGYRSCSFGPNGL